jgi:protease II
MLLLCRLKDRGRDDPGVLAYLAAENAYTQGAMEQLVPLTAELEDDMLTSKDGSLGMQHMAWNGVC